MLYFPSMEAIKGIGDTIASHLGDPVALVVALVLGAIAISGRFSVRMTQLLLVLAWMVVWVALRNQSWAEFGIGVAGFGFLVAILAIFFRPETVPQHCGVLIPGRKLFFSRKKRPSIEIGNGGAIFFWGGPKDEPIFDFTNDIKLKIELIRGKIHVSTKVKDDSGNIVAEIIRNQWKVAHPPANWDRSYNKDALEVIDPKGKVILQVKVLKDRVQIQGDWKQKDGLAIRFVQEPGQGAGGRIVIRDGIFRKTDPEIKPMFEYPSERNLGKLRSVY
jgi:hypothetical protein